MTPRFLKVARVAPTPTSSNAVVVIPVTKRLLIVDIPTISFSIIALSTVDIPTLSLVIEAIPIVAIPV